VKRIGITGGIGSGKSTAAGFFEERGYPVIYADPLAKKLMSEEPTTRDRLRSLLGELTYRSDGSLDTDFVAGVIFSDPGKKKALERIVHPAVLKSIDTYLKNLEEKGTHRLAFVEAALIFESGMEKMLDFVVVITAPETVRIERVANRDNVRPDEVRKRIGAQQTDDYLRRHADFVIENTKDVASLRGRCLFLESLFLSME
jgi:dephospho-CoA kinase